MSDHECFRCPECGSCPACAADALDRVIDEAESLRERLDQFEAYAMPNVATALDRIAAAEARAERAERERDVYRHEWNVSSRQQGAETRARYAAEARAERLLTALQHLLKAFLVLHRAYGTGSAEQWPEVEDARAAIAAEEGK